MSRITTLLELRAHLPTVAGDKLIEYYERGLSVQQAQNEVISDGNRRLAEQDQEHMRLTGRPFQTNGVSQPAPRVAVINGATPPTPQQAPPLRGAPSAGNGKRDQATELALIGEYNGFLRTAYLVGTSHLEASRHARFNQVCALLGKSTSDVAADFSQQKQ